MSTPPLTLGDLLTLPHFANFQPQVSILRLPESNVFTLKGRSYELRLFTFFLSKPIETIQTFADFVRTNHLENTPLTIYHNLRHIKPLSYSFIDENTY